MMDRLPKVIASSVIRLAQQGESHGRVYLVDLQSDSHHQVVDWRHESIDWEGRGGARGLRGIACYGDQVYLAASDEILVYSKDFRPIESFRNEYLKDCHEIFVHEHRLFLTSTEFYSVLVFNLVSKSFVKGYCLRYGQLVMLTKKYFPRFGRRLSQLVKPKLSVFDPNSDGGPRPQDTVHINSVSWGHGAIYVSGTALGALLCVPEDRLLRFPYARIPLNTHNARPFREGVLLNDTLGDRVAYLDRSGYTIESWPVKRYRKEEVMMSHLPEDCARQGFARGLATRGDLVIGGSSPATISVYRFGHPYALKTINISMDVRDAIHGLEVWPY